MTGFPRLPLKDWIESLESWLESHFQPLFDVIRMIIGSVVGSFEFVFDLIPAPLMIVIFTVLAYVLGRWKLALFTLVGFLLIWNLELWDPTMQTLALVLTSALVSIMIGVPVGVWCAQSNAVQSVVTPVLDFMQTMPAFVYLIPAVSFFSLGVVPGVIASVIFAIPPTIRLTNLGIRQVPKDLTEAADAFGSTPSQKLFKLQLPLAVPTIMAGVNQTIMLSLSMVVIASMIGAQGVGSKVYQAITQVKTGVGFEAGLAVVILAIVLDRFTHNLIKKGRGSNAQQNKGKKHAAVFGGRGRGIRHSGLHRRGNRREEA